MMRLPTTWMSSPMTPITTAAALSRLHAACAHRRLAAARVAASGSMPSRSNAACLIVLRSSLPALPVIGKPSKCNRYAGTMWLGRFVFRNCLQHRARAAACR